MTRYLPVLISIAFTIYTLVECARTEQSVIRGLPKWAWILLIILIGLLGAIGYWIWGRPKNQGPGRGGNRKIIPPDDNPDFLRKL